MNEEVSFLVSGLENITLKDDWENRSSFKTVSNLKASQGKQILSNPISLLIIQLNPNQQNINNLLPYLILISNQTDQHPWNLTDKLALPYLIVFFLNFHELKFLNISLKIQSQQ